MIQHLFGVRPDATIIMTDTPTETDISVVHPCSPSYVRNKTSDKAILNRERAKCFKHTGPAQAMGSKFSPVVLETYGRFGPASLKFVKRLVHESTSYRASLTRLIQMMSVTLQKGNARVERQGLVAAIQHACTGKGVYIRMDDNGEINGRTIVPASSQSRDLAPPHDGVVVAFSSAAAAAAAVPSAAATLPNGFGSNPQLFVQALVSPHRARAQTRRSVSQPAARRVQNAAHGRISVAVGGPGGVNLASPHPRAAPQVANAGQGSPLAAANEPRGPGV